jgi:cellobiose transport system permease protein
MTVNVGAEPRHAAPPPAPARPPATPRWAVRLGRWDIKWSPYLYVAPFFVLFGIFGLFPIGYTIYVSLFDWSLLAGKGGFVGLDNYAELIADDQFWNAVYNTFGIFLLATIPQLVVALMIANLLNRKIRSRTAFRLGVLAPNVTSVVAVGIVFGFIFAEQYGLANYLLNAVGLDSVQWRAGKLSSWTAIATMVDWRWTGYNALIFLGAMQAIPRDLYESAALDGAGTWRQFWRITVPLIRPAILFCVIISTIGGLQLFTEPLMLAYGRPQGGNLHQFQTVAMYIYETTFDRNFEYGYGAAISWMLFVLIIIFSAFNFALVRRSIGGKSK